jgi:cysteinyl-tRNA synthetase
MTGPTTLSLYDTLARQKMEFIPRDPQRVTMYVCGPTVYSYAHIGNARAAVVFDVLYRVLRHLFGPEHVVYARNITDVDDKINKAAQEQGVDIRVITDKFAQIYNADMGALGCLAPTVQPRATEHIGEMQTQIAALIAHGAAYAAEGHVLFDTEGFRAAGGNYGALSGRSLDDMIAGARVEVAPYKKNPADFVLWKPSKPGEPAWESPWGPGRPGWHIECSAMSEKELGLPFDLHGGGHDLIFPHHENEIAQACGAHGARDPRAYARHWMHNGFLTMDSEKMSKSLGNVVLPHELVKQVPGEVVRWALLSAHYRAPLDWNEALIEQSRRTLDGLYQVLRDAKARPAGTSYDRATWQAPQIDPKVETFAVLLCNDLSTTEAMSELASLRDQLRALLNDPASTTDQIGILRDALVQAGAILGFLQQDPDAWFEGGADDAFKEKVEGLIAARAQARKAKDFAAADRLRDEIAALGVEVLDGKDGATWRKKS